MPEARSVSVTIDVAPEAVYRFASNPANMSKWAPAFARSGATGIRFVEKNAFLVLDHYVRTAAGVEVYVAGRVVANGKGSEVILTFFRGEGMTDEAFESDLEQVQGDLNSLQELLESGVREPDSPAPRASTSLSTGSARNTPPVTRYAVPSSPASPSVPNPKNLFVGGIPYELTEMELERLFAACGEVARCRLLADRESGKSKGLAFVEMATLEGAQKALQTLNGSEIKGRKIFVTEAKPPDQRDREPGRKPAGFGKKPWQKPGEARPGQRDFRSLGEEQSKPWEKRPHEKKAWGDKKPRFGDKKPWGKPSTGFKKPWGKPGDKPAGKPGGFKKPWGKPAGKPGGFKKPWSKKPPVR